MNVTRIKKKMLVVAMLAVITYSISLYFPRNAALPKGDGSIYPVRQKLHASEDNFDIVKSLKEVVISVTYDKSNRIWISGRSVDGTVEVQSIDELNEKLSKINPKGKAIITMTHDVKELSGNDGLLGPLPSRNLDLEKKISDSLMLQGYSR